jgi:hypothetical protein
MDEEPQISVYLLIYSDDTQMDFDECTAAVGTTPTCTARSKVASLPGAEWGIGIEKKEAESIGEVLDEVLIMISNYKDRIVSYANQKGYTVLVICTVTIWAFPPLYELTPSHLREMAELGAEFRMDIYDRSGYARNNY